MAIDVKYEYSNKRLVRDTRPFLVRLSENARKPENVTAVFSLAAVFVALVQPFFVLADLILLFCLFYFIWVFSRKVKSPYRVPSFDKKLKGDGILFVGNQRGSGKELWASNSDARTHILYLGTTGSGKTEGLKSLSSNALTWGSGFVYVDGKADTDLWGAMYSMCRRFGREDDLLVLNYMTGNSDTGSISNSMNPFAAGSASYLTNMMVGLMEDAGGDNAMWKGRAISLMTALMPGLTYKRDHQGLLLDVQVIRDSMGMEDIIKVSRDPNLPPRITQAIKGYLRTLPGYVDEAFNDDGTEKGTGADMTTPRQQHGYLTMQFTRSLGSLADDYGHVFKTQLADIDMMDVVLNRRMLVVLIPALEKSADEAANLGKIIAATIKGMMGSTLGSSVEGEWEQIIENKVTKSSSPFMTIFDEVGYYTATGMAVMAAQARSLGFCLIFAAQDLPALEKRVKEEARSITANCNMKIFGKLEDPTQTREFFENTVGGATISKATQYEMQTGSNFGNYRENTNTSLSDVKKASYGELKGQKEGEAHIAFNSDTLEVKMFYANPSKVGALRVHRMLRVSPNLSNQALKDPAVNEILNRFGNPKWTAADGETAPELTQEIHYLMSGFDTALQAGKDPVTAGALAVTQVAQSLGMLEDAEDDDDDDDLALDHLISNVKTTTPSRPASLVSLEKEDDEDESSEKGGILSWNDLIGGSAFGSGADNKDDSDDLPDFSSFADIPNFFGDDDDDIQENADLTPQSVPSAPAMPAPTRMAAMTLEELEAPPQEINSFITDIMKRAGSAFSKHISAVEKA